MDYKYEAEKILSEHTTAILCSCRTGFDNTHDMLEFTTSECGFILTKHLLDGDYTPMQYNAVRNELASMLWNLFGPHIEREEAEKLTEFVKAFSL